MGLPDLARLIVLVSAEQALGGRHPGIEEEERATLAMVCAAALREAQGPEPWSGVEDVIAACRRRDLPPAG